MSEWEFWSADRQFVLRIGERAVARLLHFAMRCREEETGGILVGFYTKALDCAVVTAVSGPPPDSQGARIWFARGIRGLQRWLERLWRTEGDHYLGEWHVHPGAAPDPSRRDIEQMQQIAASELYRCPEPILLIIGGDLRRHGNARAFVFPRGQDPVEVVRAHCVGG